jgi:protein TonB
MSPSHLRRPHAGRLPILGRGLLLLLLAASCATALAQAAPIAGAPSGELTPSQRAKRDAEKVFQWIRIHSDKPRRASAPGASVERSGTPQPVAARGAAVAKASPKPAEQDAAASAVAAEQPVLIADTAASAPAALATAPATETAAPDATAPAAARDAGAPLAAAMAAPAIEEDTPLVAVLRTEPDFPASLMRQLRKGTVQVAFTVQPDGSVAQARSVSSSHPRLVQSAVATVTQWRFQPLHHAQQAVVEIGFNLE